MHDGQQLHESLGTDGILRRESTTIFDDGVLYGYAATAPVIANEILTIMNRARQGITRAQVPEERFGVQVITIDIRLFDNLREGF